MVKILRSPGLSLSNMNGACYKVSQDAILTYGMEDSKKKSVG